MFEARKNGRIQRKSIDKKLHKEYSEKICKKILEFVDDKNVIMLYNAIDGEVDVNFISELKNKTFLYPRVEDNEIIAVQSADFEIGSYGIKEPTGESFNGKIDAVIVPMCAYDNQLNRLGFGKGYYDRFLSKNYCLKIGVAFSCQKTENIKVKDTDVKMDIIITEKEILEAK